MQDINNAVQAVSDHLNMLTANVKHLTAESAGLLRVFEVAMQLVASNEEWTPAQREQLALAVKACNQVTNTAKAIRGFEAAGMDLLRNEIEKMVGEGVSERFMPGINLCLGSVSSLALHHRTKRE
ncbi:hypothetical protein [Pantoea sp. CCBC3-3-1]|uniref:hypothetical protein n=1 Tax=Pantoea sp. CCBC3-3-1 TaxID=2490851 RepID=UPI0011BE3C79|nr:hypothetical protein [Pantoea sp. CCBC3-3-1]